MARLNSRSITNRSRMWCGRPMLYVIADPRDNSVSFSPRLWNRIRRKAIAAGVNPRVLTFRMSDSGAYAFTLDADVEEQSSMSKVQYDPRTGSIGFESLIPTVNKIFYDYGAPTDEALSPVKMAVRRVRNNNMEIYILKSPWKV